MAYLRKHGKAVLLRLAAEFDTDVSENNKVLQIIKAILGASDYVEEKGKIYLERVLGELELERKQEEDKKKEAREREIKEELASDAKKRRKHEMLMALYDLEIERLRRLNAEKWKGTVLERKESGSSIREPKTIPKFDPSVSTISEFLDMFEHNVREIKIEENLWVSYLTAFLPTGILKENSTDFAQVKDFLLKWEIDVELLKTEVFQSQENCNKADLLCETLNSERISEDKVQSTSELVPRVEKKSETSLLECTKGECDLAFNGDSTLAGESGPQMDNESVSVCWDKVEDQIITKVDKDNSNNRNKLTFDPLEDREFQKLNSDLAKKEREAVEMFDEELCSQSGENLEKYTPETRVANRTMETEDLRVSGSLDNKAEIASEVNAKVTSSDFDLKYASKKRKTFETKRQIDRGDFVDLFLKRSKETKAVLKRKRKIRNPNQRMSVKIAYFTNNYDAEGSHFDRRFFPRRVENRKECLGSSQGGWRKKQRKRKIRLKIRLRGRLSQTVTSRSRKRNKEILKTEKKWMLDLSNFKTREFNLDFGIRNEIAEGISCEPNCLWSDAYI